MDQPPNHPATPVVIEEEETAKASAHLARMFTCHSATDDQANRYRRLRTEAHMFAQLILNTCPASAERTLAIRKIREAVMWANASIAINESTT